MENKSKTILGLDLGTNSIGWALIKHDDENKTGEIIAAGSRILPLSQDVLSKFDSGQSISQTAERTGFRSTRRLRERHLLRRERLHRVLNILGFLPSHYASKIDFTKHYGQFLPETEPKIPWAFDASTNKYSFLFNNSFSEMLHDFAIHQPQLLQGNKKIPYDWTIYYLRKKALTAKVEKEELAWILLNFNQKRGYYQLRGEEEEENQNKLIEFYSLRVTDVVATEEKKNKDEIWYSVHLENGWIYRRTSKVPLDWTGKTRDFIVTTELNDDGSIKKDKEGKEKRSIRTPAEDDWTLVKKKTEAEIDKSHKTVGAYIYDTLLQNPKQKIKGKLVRVIERKFYKAELEAILNKQKEFHPELNNESLYQDCLKELYRHNETHRNSISKKDFTHLFLNDIIFYQRPLKSKKSLISNCKYESRTFIKNGKKETAPLKCIAKSHPLFQEFRLWQFIQNIAIYQKEKETDGKLQTDINVTNEFIKSKEDLTALFDWLNERKEIDQKAFLKYPAFNLKKNTDQYRWNYVEDKIYPCNETRAQIKNRLNKLENVPENFLTKETEEALWHILYSVEDKNDIQKALATFADKNKLSEEFVELFKKFPPFKKEYGSLSAKAIKKLLPLMRVGKYWNEADIDEQTTNRINKIMNGECDETIRDRVREKALHLTEISDFQGLPVWLASYIAYDRHSEDRDLIKWKTPANITLLQQHSLRNPIVEQVINETLQVVKDIWLQYGKREEPFFNEIHLELGREMKNPAEKRRQMTNQINENENTNLRIKALLLELLNDSEVENVRPWSPTQQEILKIYEEGILNAENNIPDDILKITKQAQPTTSELIRYKLWLQQKYRSPYTGEIIPLNKLFTRSYDIEHIIPQSRYFDDSLSNKVICETVVNGEHYKSNRTGYEFIKEFGGKVVDELSTTNRTVKIFTANEYEDFIKNNYAKNRTKMKKLLMEEIPETFLQRQLNDTRYISKVVKSLLSNIVREDDELEAISKNVITSNGNITSVLKQDWGLNDVWNDIIRPRFERLNELTNSKNFGDWTNKEGNKVFQTQVPLQLQKGFSKKRIDHRHHSLDAIVIACASRNHINYLNNESALGNGKLRSENEKMRYNLRHKLCSKKYNDDTKRNYTWVFNKPWPNFTFDAKETLYNIIPGFKQNLRVINKTKNQYYVWRKDENGILKKELVTQTEGESWAIRKPMHKDTISGIVQLKFKKTVSLAAAIDNWEMMVDKNFKNHIKKLINLKYDKKKLLKYFKEKNNKWNDQDISRVEIHYWNKENVASRVKVDESFNSSIIKCVTDTGIQSILKKHLDKYNEEKNGNTIEHPELAFSPDGIDELNKNIIELNGGKPHQPIFKVRTYEPKGNKFNIGQTGNKKYKYAEAAKGTNLFFAIYKDDNGKRNYDTIPLNIVIERQKQGLTPVPEKNEAGHPLYFYLSPNDLVYIPNEEELATGNFIDFGNLNNVQLTRVYKIVSFTGSRLYAIPCHVATSIVDKVEFSQLNKMEFSLDKISIRDYCIKLKTDRLGNLKRDI
jgi:CRISPR-associated endonuclease Csn1